MRIELGDFITEVASTPEQFTALPAKETEKYNKIIKTAGIKSQ